MEEIELKKKHNSIKPILLVLTIILALGISLAVVYFIYVYQDSRESTIESGLISINFQETGSTVNLTNAVPVIDEVGLTNTPYSFTVQNTSLVPINAKVSLVLNNSTNIALGAVKYAFYINNELQEIANVHDTLLYTIENMQPNQTLNCKLVFWIDYYYSEPNKVFNANIKVEGESIDIIYNNQ